MSVVYIHSLRRHPSPITIARTRTTEQGVPGGAPGHLQGPGARGAGQAPDHGGAWVCVYVCVLLRVRFIYLSSLLDLIRQKIKPSTYTLNSPTPRTLRALFMRRRRRRRRGRRRRGRRAARSASLWPRKGRTSWSLRTRGKGPLRPRRPPSRRLLRRGRRWGRASGAPGARLPLPRRWRQTAGRRWCRSRRQWSTLGWAPAGGWICLLTISPAKFETRRRSSRRWRRGAGRRRRRKGAGRLLAAGGCARERRVTRGRGKSFCKKGACACYACVKGRGA